MRGGDEREVICELRGGRRTWMKAASGSSGVVPFSVRLICGCEEQIQRHRTHDRPGSMRMGRSSASATGVAVCKQLCDFALRTARSKK